MTKAEITKIITNYLTSTPIILIDLLNKSIKLNSYDKYLQEFTLARKTFQDSITEFCDEAISYLKKMEEFIKKCESVNSNIEDYVRNNLRNEIGVNWSAEIRAQLILVGSLPNTPECTEMVIKQIYQELGYENLKYYIDLLKTPSYLNTYLGDSKKQIVAMHYILFKTSHHSKTRLSRNLSTQNLYNLMVNSIDDSIKEITSEKNNYINFMNEEKEHYSNWFDKCSEDHKELYINSQNEYQEFLKDSRIQLEALEKTYSEKLKVEEPSSFMKNKAKEYARKAWCWAVATVGLAVFLIILLGLILNPEVSVSKKIITIQLFSNEMPVYSSIIIFAIIALIIYVLKLFIKMAISSKHLSEEYYQKHVLTYFYLSLVKDNKVEQEHANIILATLFAKADTGLIKNDTSSDIESIYKLMLSTK